MNETVTKQKGVELTNGASLLSAAQCALTCGISRRSWFRLVASARVPACVRVGASPRWRREDLELWIRWNCPDRKEFEARKETEQC